MTKRVEPRGILMPMIAEVADTPYYVLMDGNRRLGPTVAQSNSKNGASAIYGFSDKRRYDKFVTNSQVALTPYPLVQGYLREHVAVAGDGLQLVVVDAAGPAEPYLHAATIEAVLKAQEKRMPHVTAAHLLRFDQQANAYRLDLP